MKNNSGGSLQGDKNFLSPGFQFGCFRDEDTRKHEVKF